MWLSVSGPLTDFWSVFLSVQGFGWALNWTSQAVRMMDQWEEWGTSAAHQNMESLLLRLVFKGECTTGLWLTTGQPEKQNRFVKQACLINYLKFRGDFWRIWQYIFKPWGSVSLPSSTHLISLKLPFDSHLCGCWHIWLCHPWANGTPSVPVIKESLSCQTWSLGPSLSKTPQFNVAPSYGPSFF